MKYWLVLAFLLTGSLAQDFCWKDSYGRGVGTVPNTCPSNKDKLGALCYQKCGRNMRRAAVDCHSVCPSGMRDDGLYCRKAEYGRGAGYPWKFGDGFNNHGMYNRCQRDHGWGRCEQHGAIVYPKCAPGYSPAGCCICRPHRPNCHALGLGTSFDLSCGKRIEVGRPSPMQCSWNKEKDAGLCYYRCRAGYNGVGPVCWGQPPRGWVNCGMGAAKNSGICASVIAGQIQSVGEMAVFIGTLGVSSAATGTGRTAEYARKILELKKKFKQMKEALQRIKSTKEAEELIKLGKKAKGVADIVQATETAVTPEDMARVAAQIAALVDPSGVSSTVAAYTYPKCSKYF